MIYDPLSANPLAGNPLLARADVEKALHDLFKPLLPYFSSGGARVRLDAAAAHFDRAAADLEGYARPLWGLVPYAAGGGQFAHWRLYRDGLANGTDPGHPEYWGDIKRTDQRLVELAAIGLALRMVPHLLWDPLEQKAKDNIAAYLLNARQHDYANCNWKFFRILLDLGLEQVGIAFDRALTTQYIEEIEGFYMGEGWYRDGPFRRVDHYIPFAMHYYGLLYAVLAKGDNADAAKYRERAARFTQDFQHWFDDEGGTLAFGRSLTYRFACGGLWGALAFADLEALPWGVIKGHYMRHLRWWSKQPFADRDGILSIGYAYPNLLISESYSSAGSPYWAMKAFLPLALPESHPFWQAKETPAEFGLEPVPLKYPGMVMMHTPGNVVALSSGQENVLVRFNAEKYLKYVYSSRYAFSIEADDRRYEHAAMDGMIGFSDDGWHFRMRESCADARISGDTLYSRWHPWDDVTVETWLIPANPWHVRVHRVTTPRQLHATEGGFAIGRSDFGADECLESLGLSLARSKTDLSVMLDLSSIHREGRAHLALPNTNLMSAKTILPQLRGSIPVGTTVLVTAVMALPSGEAAEAALANPPGAPDLAGLEALIATDGRPVTAVLVAGSR